MGPADNVSIISANSTSATSSKSSIVKQIELECRRSELQVLEELATSRKAKVEAKTKAAEAKAEAEAAAAAALAAAAEETLPKLRLQAAQRLVLSFLKLKMQRSFYFKCLKFQKFVN